MKRALLLINIQNDFLPNGSSPIIDGNEVMPIIKDIVDRFDLIIAIKDWHPKDHISFCDNHSRPIGDEVVVGDIKQELFVRHCVQHTNGAGSPIYVDDVFHKSSKTILCGTNSLIDGYSGFFDNARLIDTGLNGYLKEKGVGNIWISGLGECVKNTAMDAVALGYQTSVIEDCCKGFCLIQNYDATIAIMKSVGIKIISNINR